MVIVHNLNLCTLKDFDEFNLDLDTVTLTLEIISGSALQTYWY